MTELQPCPFCGLGNTPVAREGDTYWVRCGYAFCRAAGPSKSTPSLAKLAWNQAHRHTAVLAALPVEETLHDKYTMAALTGLLAYSVNEMPNGNYHSNCSVEGCIADARKYADAAMKARGT